MPASIALRPGIESGLGTARVATVSHTRDRGVVDDPQGQSQLRLLASALPIPSVLGAAYVTAIRPRDPPHRFPSAQGRASGRPSSLLADLAVTKRHSAPTHPTITYSSKASSVRMGVDEGRSRRGLRDACGLPSSVAGERGGSHPSTTMGTVADRSSRFRAVNRLQRAHRRSRPSGRMLTHQRALTHVG